MKDLSLQLAVATESDASLLAQLQLPSPPHQVVKAKSVAEYEPVVTRSASIPALLQEHITQVLADAEPDDAFYVADVGDVVRQHVQWMTLLPGVEPFYAVKCNPDPMILRTMARLGNGFDCASKAEIDAALATGVDPTRIIYANPCKAASHIRHASAKGVRMMTFDNADELHKIKKWHANPQMVLRVLTDDSRSLCRFGVKFGAHPEVTRSLLQLAKDLDIEVVGVSFHVGSGCFDASAFHDAVVTARRVFDEAAELGMHLELLDLGGGYPGADCSTGITFAQIADVLRPALASMFPATRIIAEPGRYFVSNAYTLAVNVHARRVVEAKDQEAQKSFMYYINEGLYSSFNCLYFDHAHVSPKVLVKDGVYVHGQEVGNGETHACSIWGPTCDSMDVITRDGQLPELDVGDWLYFDAMGAYTVAAASTFNGFRRCHVIWTNTEAHRLLI
ncbi:hypothetical protein GGF31_000804 [Allomyces arbusculus]|nr:hypothetical protein GGF31_000804 [Allomyces arbusculus]